MSNEQAIDSGALGRIGRGLFIVIIGPDVVRGGGDRDFGKLERKLRESIGDSRGRLTGLDLMDAFVALKSREKLVDELRAWRPTKQNRILDLIVALRPPLVFTNETTGLIIRAARDAHLETNICFPEKDPIKPDGFDPMTLVPLQGLVDKPDSLILSDADRETLAKREKRTFHFLKDRLANHELLFIGFDLTDHFLNRMLRELGREMARYDRRALILADAPSDLERNLIERRRGRVLTFSRAGAIGFLEALPEKVQRLMASGPPMEELHVRDLVDKLRFRIHDETKKMLTTGLSQPEHLETGEPPTINDIYVEPTLSSWEGGSGEIDIEAVAHLAREYQGEGKPLPRKVADLIARIRPGGRLDAPREFSRQMIRSLERIGYNIGSIIKYQKSSPLDILKEHDRIVIIGPPASGKTQLLRYLAYKITDSNKSDPKFKNIVPVFAHIREYHVQREAGVSLLTFLQKRLAGMIGEEEDAVAGLFEQNRVMLLLDGLDEVQSDEARGRVAEEIEELFSVFEGMRRVVTSRPAGYRAARIARNLPHLELDSLDDSRIQRLLLNWYRRIIFLENQDWPRERINQKAEEARADLFSRFESFEGLLDLVRNPLMLTIAIFIHHIGLELPERRADFYNRAVQLLSRTWIKAKFRERIELPREETFTDALERIAFKLHVEARENLISGDDLFDLLVQVFTEREGYGEERAKREAENLKELMRSLIGVMVERAVDRFGFTHLSFQEYFTARYLALGDGRSQAISVLSQNLFKAAWDQVLRMYLQIAPRDDANKVFDALEQTPHPFDKLFHTRIRRLADLLAEPNLIGPERRGEVLDDLMNLAVDKKHRFMLRDLAEKIKPLADVNDRAIKQYISILLKNSVDEKLENWLIIINLIKILGEKRPEVAEMLIERLDKDDDSGVRRASIGSLSKLGVGSPDVIQALIERLEKDNDGDVRRASIDALMNLDSKNPEVIHALVERLDKDDDSGVRRASIRSLSGLGKKSHEVIRTLIETLEKDDADIVRLESIKALYTLNVEDVKVVQAITKRLDNDSSNDVRKLCIEVLVKSGQKKSEVIQALIERIEKDVDRSVRIASIHALAKLRVKKPEVIQALIERFEKDDDSKVRSASVYSLAWLGRKEPEAIQALIDRLKKDNNSGVRKVTIRELSKLDSRNPEVIQALIERLEKDDDSGARIASIDAFINLNSKGPKVIQALVERLEKEDDSIVRIASIGALTKLGAKNPEVMQALIERLEKDDDSGVRIASIGALSNFDSKNPVVIQALIERTSRDKDVDVIYSSIDDLHRLNKKGHEAIEMLVERIRMANNEVHRVVPLEALINIRAKTPEIGSSFFLKQMREKYKYVLQPAVETLLSVGVKEFEIVAALYHQVEHNRNDLVAKCSIEAVEYLCDDKTDIVESLLKRIKFILKPSLPGLLNLPVRELERMSKKHPEIIAMLQRQLKVNTKYSILEGVASVLDRIGAMKSEMINIVLQRVEKGEISKKLVFTLIIMGERRPEMVDMLFRQIKETGNVFAGFERSKYISFLAKIIDKSNVEKIRRGIEVLDIPTLSSFFSVFGNMFLDLEFLRDESDDKNVKRKVKASKSAKVKRGKVRLIKKKTRPDLKSVQELATQKKAPSGTNGLKVGLDFLLGQYPVIPRDEKKMVRTLAADWFVAKAGEVVEADKEKREELAADLEALAEFLNRFFMLIRDEDHAFKKEQFKRIWPSIIALQDADALALRSVARSLFDVLDSLYIYMPDAKQKQIETKIARWRKNTALPADHPILVDPAIERILKMAKIRRG